MRSRRISSSILMDVSESRIELARRSGSAEERMFVQRLFEKPATYGRWEAYHYGLMKTVAADHTAKGQLLNLRKASFGLVHRKALFQHLRDNQVVGTDREALFSAFYGPTDFANAVIAEHGNFLRSNSSLICVDHLDRALMSDARFSAELSRYQTGYAEYFSMYCNWVIAENRGEDYPLRWMLRELKQDLQRMQVTLLSLPYATDRRRYVRSFAA